MEGGSSKAERKKKGKHVLTRCCARHDRRETVGADDWGVVMVKGSLRRIGKIAGKRLE